MLVTININGSAISKVVNVQNVEEIKSNIKNEYGLSDTEYYLTQNGKLITNNYFVGDCNVNLTLRMLGGKGGFGSMLRAIGAQIEKTTNREACRDLSGRRLRDINEEKRLKTFLEKLKEKEDDTDDKKKKKLERMLMKPKHEFKDEAYEQARQELTQQIDDAVEQGNKKTASDIIDAKTIGQKRKNEAESKEKKKKKKKNPALWLGADDLSSSTDTDSDSESASSSSKSQNIKLSVSTKVSTITNSEETVDK